nr:MAG TPA: N-acetylmuramoyl-L-alanine amidase [Caudoviricetes sp.]
MGNLYAESGLNPKNLQNSYEKKLGYTDAQYTAAVDNGKYKNFVKDSAGYGLAQWTYWSRKQALIDFCKTAGTSIGDLDMQLNFLWKELSDGYRGVINVLMNATSVIEASNTVLLQFERPADQSASVQLKRAEYGQAYYDKYANKNQEGGSVVMSNSSLVSYTKISPNKSSPRNHSIDRISIHCVVGQCSVETLGNIFAPTSRQASSNYGIGLDGKIGMYVEEKDRSWCTSSSSNDNRAVTIEVASDTYDPYKVTDAAYASLLDLVTDICKRNGKTKIIWFGDKEKTLSYTPKPNEMVMTVHRWFANKSCPGDYLYNKHPEIAAEVNRRLSGGNAGIEEEDEDMTLETFKKLMNEYRTELRDNDCGSWSKEAREWAIATGLFAGGDPLPDGTPNYMWADMPSREQIAQLFYRFAQRNGLT